jgi:hypothetical protein
LGGAARLSETQRVDIRRVAELTALAEDCRAMVMQQDGGPGAVAVLVKLEGTLARAMKRLNLPPANAAAPVMGLHDIVARHAAGRADPVGD